MFPKPSKSQDENKYEKDVTTLKEAFSKFNMKVIPQRKKPKSRTKERK